jgi:tRNA A37 methylthiotransferase MiaB
MPGQVKSHVVKERAEQLRIVASRKKEAFLQCQVGKALQVLVQGHDEKSGLCRGLSRNYITVEFAGSEEVLNREVTVGTCGMGNKADLVGAIMA